MDADELERLCNALSIQELEGPVKSLDEGMKIRRERELAFCLMGKVMTKVLVNKEAFIKNFDKAIVVLEKMPLNGDITNLEYNKVEFWVQIHKIPLLCMSEEIGLFLGKMIGDVKEVDLVTAREENNQFLRIRVVVLISEPLIKSLRVDLMGSGKITTMLLWYERLHDFCLTCRRIGHGIQECTVAGDIKEVMSEANYRLCIWLRTGSPPKKSQNRFGRNENMSIGNYMGTYNVKENRLNHGRFQENWRNPKSISEGMVGDGKGLSSKPPWREKEKRPLISKDGCMGKLENSRVHSRKNKPREAESGMAMCIDSYVNVEEDQKLGETGSGEGRINNGTPIVVG
ncbi:hypothetical protein EZV62_012411 [Acer yangbiense]|uniref:Zinc knuckle CX2CX4HX4C domain-containing protein n=1 Tax=Acer yangbiense TaxID=1000413 RepID=A0A5C7HW72_9ROSI|nr:hypothetical protein EZV62_012411 [Acer yangbiense]